LAGVWKGIISVQKRRPIVKASENTLRGKETRKGKHERGRKLGGKENTIGESSDPRGESPCHDLCLYGVREGTSTLRGGSTTFGRDHQGRKRGRSITNRFDRSATLYTWGGGFGWGGGGFFGRIMNGAVRYNTMGKKRRSSIELEKRVKSIPYGQHQRGRGSF